MRRGRWVGSVPCDWGNPCCDPFQVPLGDRFELVPPLCVELRDALRMFLEALDSPCPEGSASSRADESGAYSVARVGTRSLGTCRLAEGLPQR